MQTQPRRRPPTAITVTHRATSRALAHYQSMAAEADPYRRQQDLAVQIAVDAMLMRIRQHNASGCDAPCDAPCDATPRPAPAWLFWTFACGFSATLTFASYEFATRVLPVLWKVLP